MDSDEDSRQSMGNGEEEKEGDKQKLLPLEKDHLIGFMERSPKHMDGLILHVGTPEEKKEWFTFITKLQESGRTTKSSEKLLSCWLGAVERVSKELRKPNPKLSSQNKRIVALLQKNDSNNLANFSGKAKLKQLKNVKNFCDVTMDKISYKSSNSYQSSPDNVTEYSHTRKRSTHSISDCYAMDEPDKNLAKKLSVWPSGYSHPSRSTQSKSSLSVSPQNESMMTFEELLDRLDNNILDLASCNLSTVPDSVCDMEFFQLRLEKNKLTSLPAYLMSKMFITRIEVQENLLESLPEDIGLLLDLKYLNVASNRLITLPISMGLLKNLKYLNVNDNPLENSLSEIAGPCLDSRDCKRCAEMIVDHLSVLKLQRETLSAAGNASQLALHDDSDIQAISNKSLEKLDNAVVAINEVAGINKEVVENQKTSEGTNVRILSVLQEILIANRETNELLKKTLPPAEQVAVDRSKENLDMDVVIADE